MVFITYLGNGIEDAQERTVMISINDGKAGVYRDEEKLGMTPYPYRGKLGERVALRDGRDPDASGEFPNRRSVRVVRASSRRSS